MGENLNTSSLASHLKSFGSNLLALKPAETFIALGLIFGLLFLFLTPPMQTPDEVQHFYRSYQISELHFTASKVNNGYGGTIPVSVEKIAPLLKGNIPGNDSNKVKLSTLHFASKIKLNPSVSAPIRFDNATINSPIVYFPQAFGVGLGRIVHLNPFWLIYLGRFFNLIIWLIIVYLAIKLTPVGKWAFAAIALIPMSLSQVASLSPDALQVGFAALLIASILNLRARDKKLSTKGLVLFSILIICISLLKVAYLPLLLTVLFVPKRVIGNWFKTGLIVVAFAIGFAWNLSILPNAKTIPPYLGLPTTINSHLQTHYVLHNPVTYSSTLLVNLFGPPSSAVAPSIIGLFGWNDTTLPYWIQIIAVLTLVAALLYRNEKKSVIESITRKSRIGWAILILITMVLLYTTLYIGYTPIATNIIDGIQGRYFIPVAFLLIPIAAQSAIQLKIRKEVFPKIMLYLLSFSLVASLITISIRFY